MPDTTIGLATSFITFSRPGASGGGATTTLSNGRIGWAGHNLLTNSESFDASAWGKYLTTVTANSTASPNGTTTADTIVASSSNGTIYQSSVIPVGTSTFSCWFKAGTLTSVKVIFDGGAGTGREATFTLSGSGTAGAVANSGSGAGTLSGGTSSITPLSDGWYLCTIAGVTTTAAAGLTLLLATSGNVIAWGAHLYRSDLGGMQLNPAMPAGMQSYYPTTPRNALGWTESFDNAAWQTSAATVTANAAISPVGLNNADLITSTGDARIGQNFTAVANTPYTFSVWLKSDAGGTVRLAKWMPSPFGDYTFTTVTLTAAWQRFSFTFTPVSSGVHTVWIGTDNSLASGRSLYAWGAQLSDSASLDTYVPQYGAAVTSAAYYAPRLDFDPVTLAAKGLLVEEARTNIIRDANAFDVATWGKTAGGTGSAPVVTANDAIAPDGTMTAQKVSFNRGAGNTGSDISSLASTISGYAASTAYTASLYIKAAAAGDVGKQLAWRHVGEAGYGTITLTASWQRITRTETSFGTSCTIEIVSRGTITTDNTVGAHIWGAAVEVGASNAATTFATSVIPTNGATATRAADVASVSTQAFPYSASTGSLIANISYLAGTATRANAEPAVTLEETNSKGVSIYNGGGQNAFYVRDGGTDVAYLQLAPAIAANTPVKVAGSYALNDFAAAANGGTVLTDTSGTPPTANLLRLGNWNSVYFCGHIRQITYLPRRISNAELQSRSA